MAADILTDLQIAHCQLRRFGDTRPGVVEEQQKSLFGSTL